MRIGERNNTAYTKAGEEGGGGGAPGAGAEIPLQPVVKTMVRQAVPLQPMDVHGGADIHLQPVEDPTLEQVDVPEGDCDPMGDPRWSSLFLKDCIPWKGHVERTHAGAVCEDLQSVGRTHVGEIHGGLPPVGGTPCWSRGRA